MFALKDLLAKAVEVGASDLHLKVNQKPFLRLHGHLTETAFSVVTAADLDATIAEVMPRHLAAQFSEQHEADFSYHIESIGRFRVNAFQTQGVPSLAFRYVKTRIPSFEDLNLPLALKKLAAVPRGIIVISGATGSGKSTTLAAVIEEMNISERLRIITIEDPVEYMFIDKQCIVSQREVGLDTLSFQAALRHIMRQDPDVIVIGEMRDQLSFKTALTAAETGHIVITTLHSGTASAAILRMLQFFPSNEWEQTRMSIAANLQAVVCQRLVRATQGGVVPAVEIMFNTPIVRKLMETDRLEILPAAIETGSEDGMQTFNQALYKLIKAGTITQDEGMQHAGNPAALRMNLQGIFLDEARRILATT
jgi:twitching motility protein PilT